jgi:CRP-like cAMP-binding protein
MPRRRVQPTRTVGTIRFSEGVPASELEELKTLPWQEVRLTEAMPGLPGIGLYVIEQGLLALDIDKQVQAFIFGEDDFFGEIRLLFGIRTGELRPVGGSAKLSALLSDGSPESGRAIVQEIARASPTTAVNMFRELARRLAATQYRLPSRTVERRVLTALLHHWKVTQNTRWLIKINELAGLVGGANRNAVAQALDNLERSGLCSRGCPVQRGTSVTAPRC